MILLLGLFSCGSADIVQRSDKYKTGIEEIDDNYELKWHDEFDNSDLDDTKWRYRAEGSVRGNGTVSKKNISLNEDGQLCIKITKDSTGKYYIGQIGTQGLFETRCGYFETRAKMNSEIGPHVAFWLQSPKFGEIIGDPSQSGTEIDIFEYLRSRPNVVYHNLHWDGYGEDHQTKGVHEEIDGVGKGFHRFGLKWTKDSYTFYVDGEETWSTDTAVSNIREYIVLSAELTGWGGDPEEGDYPDKVCYDYVRVFKPKE